MKEIKAPRYMPLKPYLANASLKQPRIPNFLESIWLFILFRVNYNGYRSVLVVTPAAAPPK